MAILATDEKGGIAKDGDIPWRVAGDMQFFKEVTSVTADPDKKNCVIMGRKTWESLPERFRPLPDRINCVLSKDPKTPSRCSGTIVLRDLILDREQIETIEALSETEIETVFIIGGAEVYNQIFKHPDLLMIIHSVIPGDYQCDTFVEVPARYIPISTESQLEFHIYWLMAKE